jgi:hypothetical protein
LYRLFAKGLDDGVAESALRTASHPAPVSPDGQIVAALDAWVRSLSLEKARVLCVSVDRDNDDLWRRYAADHSGLVLSLRHIEERSTPLLAAKQVSYSENPPVVGSGIDFLLYGNTPELRRRTLDAIFITKASKWAGQREWRALAWRPEEEALFGDYLFYPEELSAIAFGRNADPPFRYAIQSLVHVRFPHCRFEAITPCG